MISVGIIANPAAGKDIRRLVAQGRVVSDQEKSNTLLRVYAGLRSMGVERVFAMPDSSGLTFAAAREFETDIQTEYVQMPAAEHGGATARAAAAIVEDGVGAIVTLGGDGTNRNVATAGGEVPIVAISTGTNNVFPQMVEGTLAGIAAGAVASGKVSREDSSVRSKRLEIYIDGELEDIALVDVAVSRELFAGTRAVWDLGTLTDVYLTRAEPACIGISAIGAHLKRVHLDDPEGLHIKMGDSHSELQVLAPTGPGTVQKIGIADWNTMKPGNRVTIDLKPGMLALDGEREISLLKGMHVEIGLSIEGPWVVDVPRTLEALAAVNVAASRRS